jgi:hypothetical protein
MKIRWAALILTILSIGCAMSFDGLVEDAHYVDTTRSEDRGDEQALTARVDLKVGELQVEPGPTDKAYEVDLHYNEKAFKPAVTYKPGDNGTATLRVGLEGGGHTWGNVGENSIRLRLNPETPLSLRADTGVGESNIDLSGMSVTSLELQSGVGETKLSMLEPNQSECQRMEISTGVGAFSLTGLGNFNCAQMRFRGGVGGSELEFSGDWQTVGNIDIEVGVGGVKIRLPRDLGAEIRMSEGLFSELSAPEGFTKQGDVYYSDNRDHVQKVLKLRVEAGIGGVQVRWM